MANLSTCGDGHSSICWDWNEERECPICAARKEANDAAEERDAKISKLEAEVEEQKGTIDSLRSTIEKMENDRS